MDPRYDQLSAVAEASSGDFNSPLVRCWVRLRLRCLDVAFVSRDIHGRKPRARLSCDRTPTRLQLSPRAAGP